MNHDELLEQIQKDINEKAFIMEEYYPVKMLFALRAVVELHKYRIDRDGYDICVECTERSYFSVAYPCPTIQAIEKELI